ncbi:hypothetical protein [Streptomyces globisporus]
MQSGLNAAGSFNRPTQGRPLGVCMHYGAFFKKVVKDKKLSPGSCYQTRLTPKNGKLTKVSAGNCK